MRSLPLFSVLRASVFPAALLSFGLAACGSPPIEPRYAAGARGGSITVTSPAFREGGRIPVDHTCDGNDVMPELVLSAPPENTKSLLVYVEDPDAGAAVFTHMIAFNLPADLHKLTSAGDLAAAGGGEGARFGLNDFRAARFQGPCPPKGEAHRYRFRILALDTVLKLPEGTPRAQIDEAIDGHILGEGSLVGHFGH